MRPTPQNAGEGSVAASNSAVFRFNDVEVREREFSLIKAGQALTIEPKAFRVLLILLKNPQKLFPKEELLNAVWGDVAVGEGSLTRCIFLLRNALGDDTRNARYIETVATVGYRWVCKVDASDDSAEESKTAEEPGTLKVVGAAVGSRKRLRGWTLAGVGMLALCLAATVWYLHRPMPPPRITGYTQITHDGREKTLVGTDGSRLYFNQIASNSIAQIAISGGETSLVPVPVPNPGLMDVSPDGSNLLVVSGFSAFTLGPLWNVRILDGSVRRLGEACSAAFSPDGNTVAYATSVGDNCDGLYSALNDGTEVRKLASAGDYVSNIAWSPDGAVIRFYTFEKARIWEMDSNGSNLHEFLPGWHPSSAICCGRWTPDGSFFLFLMDGQIWAHDERHGGFRQPLAEPVQLTTGPNLWGTAPNKDGNTMGMPIPSKDGSRIFAQGVTPRGELTRFDSKTGTFLPFLGGISAQGLAFSRDGKSIAYVTYPQGVLWKANRDGSNPVQLTDAHTQAFLPRWSPDSSQIAFTVVLSDRPSGIYIVSPEGGAPQTLLPTDQLFNAMPTWSPDGHKIVFNSGSSALSKSFVRILDLDTHQVTNVPESNDMIGPRWSPDGRYLAAGGGNGAFMSIFDFSSQQWSEVAQKGYVDSPEWSRDGQFIYFKRIIGDRGVFRIRLKGGAPEKVADLKGWHDAGWFGAWMALDPTDAPLLLRDVASYDIYSLTLSEK